VFTTERHGITTRINKITIWLAFGDKELIAGLPPLYIKTFPAAGGLINPCNSVKNPWLKNRNKITSVIRFEIFTTEKHGSSRKKKYN
jgi:hypothetical protein